MCEILFNHFISYHLQQAGRVSGFQVRVAASQTTFLVLMVSEQVKVTTVPPSLLVPSQSELAPAGGVGGSELQLMEHSLLIDSSRVHWSLFQYIHWSPLWGQLDVVSLVWKAFLGMTVKYSLNIITQRTLKSLQLSCSIRWPRSW